MINAKDIIDNFKSYNFAPVSPSTTLERLPEPNYAAVLLEFYNSINCKIQKLDTIDDRSIKIVRNIIDNEMQEICTKIASPQYVVKVKEDI
jgi:hypothetical protein